MSVRNLNLTLDSHFIKARALSLGFCLCGVTDNAPLAEYPRYERWIQAEQHGGMSYLATPRHMNNRQDPTRLVPWVKSIVVLAWPYRLNRASVITPAGQIAGYVSSIDYHLFVQQKAQELIAAIQAESKQPLQAQFFCDSSPVLERELALRAGLGWIGCNSCLISPKFGSAFVLAEIFLDIHLTVDEPFTRDLCGTCSRCQQACPTGCILPDRTLETSRCISTLTIENKVGMPPEHEKAIGNHLFGCDICQSVCPWNRNIAPQEDSLAQMSENEMIEALLMSEANFKQRYQYSPILRAKRRSWVRNLCTVLANLGCKAAYNPLAQIFANDPNPVCRISAGRAVAALEPEKAEKLLDLQLQKETDPMVLLELKQIITKNSLR
jgi:epoxyqueuosine reductase